MSNILQLASRRFYRPDEFAGKSGRAEFWLFCLINGLFMIGLKYLFDHYAPDQFEILATFALTCIVEIMLIYLVLADISVNLRRLHDAGYSAWWFIIVVMSRAINYIFMPIHSKMDSVIYVVLFLINFFYFIILFMPSDMSEPELATSQVS